MRKPMVLFAALLGVSLWAAEFPAGQTVKVRLGQTLSSATARSGETWSGTLASDIVSNGKVLARRGAAVRGKVVEAKPSGRLSAPGVLRVQLTSIAGTPVRSMTVGRTGESHKKRNATAIGGGAALGAAIGAIAGGGKGAAIGAGAGAGAGTAGAAATGKKDVRLAVEQVVTFTLR